MIPAHPPVAQLPLQALNAPQLVALPPSAMSQLPAPFAAQPASFAADWEENDAYTLLKLSSRSLFVESSGNKIRGFIADLELFLQSCGRPVHHWGFFLLASLGTEEAEQVRRSHVAESVADYPTFKKGVETFEKFEFEGWFRAMLRTDAQAGAESVAAYAARTTDVCSKAKPQLLDGYTAVARFGSLHFWTRRLDDVRLSLARSHLPRAVVARNRADGAGVRSIAPLAARIASRCCRRQYKVGAPLPDECTRASADNTVAFVWQQSARDGRVKGAAHSLRKFSS